MINESKTANAVGGKTVRACDCCLRKRARWFCVADYAFLCQACDALVHSANEVASRHQRVRLETSSNFNPKKSKIVQNKWLFCAMGSAFESSVPTWHHVTRKARTPRQVKKIANQLLVVPQTLGSDETFPEENEDQELLCRVLVFNNPFADEVEPSYSLLNAFLNDDGDEEEFHLHIPEFLPSDLDIAEFNADIESLLEMGFNEDSCCIEEVGVKEHTENETTDVCVEEQGFVNEEVDEVEAFIMAREGVDWSFGLLMRKNWWFQQRIERLMRKIKHK